MVSDQSDCQNTTLGRMPSRLELSKLWPGEKDTFKKPFEDYNKSVSRVAALTRIHNIVSDLGCCMGEIKEHLTKEDKRQIKKLIDDIWSLG